MRTILAITLLLIIVSETKLKAQTDYITLDKQNYDYYLKGDYKNLKLTAKKLLDQNIDYYYLRMRLGILAYNKQHYDNAAKNFYKALKFNSWDTISNEYIYYCYLFSGRKADANLFLNSLPENKKNSQLKSLKSNGFSAIYASATISNYDPTLYETSDLYYEAIESSTNITAGLETYFTSKFKGNFSYTNFGKKGTFYSSSVTSGKSTTLKQNQFYAKLTGIAFSGFEFSSFGQIAFYTDPFSTTTYGRRSTSKQVSESVIGVGLAKLGWKVRFSANASYSNFGNTNQARGEVYFTYLPLANLNLYLTSSGMYQHDNQWGNTYQINEDIGFKLTKFLWFEIGVLKGNSFLYARSFGSSINNSYQIPSFSAYTNFIILLGNHFSISVSPYYCKNEIYSWDLDNYTYANKINSKSFGGSITLTYKN